MSATSGMRPAAVVPQPSWSRRSIPTMRLSPGVCDLGMGFPEFGTVSLTDLHFEARAPISVYIDAAANTGRIIKGHRPKLGSSCHVR